LKFEVCFDVVVSVNDGAPNVWSGRGHFFTVKKFIIITISAAGHAGCVWQLMKNFAKNFFYSVAAIEEEDLDRQ
jgi:hypothetical protein